MIDRAREAAEAAICADPSLGEAYASLGRLQFAGGRWDWDEGERQLQRALELSPGYAMAHMWHAQMLMAEGRVPEASEETERALELDPFSPVVLWTAGLRRAVGLRPQSDRAHWFLREAYVAAGRLKEAAETVLAAAPLAAQTELEGAYRAGGLNALLERLLRLEQERTGQPCATPASLGASLFAQLGDAEGVFRCLELAARRGELALASRLNPAFAPYRSDPRWAAYLEAMNLKE